MFDPILDLRLVDAITVRRDGWQTYDSKQHGQPAQCGRDGSKCPAGIQLATDDFVTVRNPYRCVVRMLKEHKYMYISIDVADMYLEKCAQTR